MNDIKFRAWDKVNESMHDVQGISFYHESISVDRGDGTYFANHASIFELMQYTGLKDKNGAEMYEGDVVKGSYYAGYNIGIKRIIGNVSWTSAAFKVSGVKQYEGTIVGLDGSFEVIGNIYENPELLGDSQ